jgi:hypothetical protein
MEYVQCLLHKKFLGIAFFQSAFLKLFPAKTSPYSCVIQPSCFIKKKNLKTELIQQETDLEEKADNSATREGSTL